MTEISPKLHSGKVSAPDKSLGDAVGLRFGRGLNIRRTLHKSQKNLFLYSLFLPWKAAVDVVFQYCAVSHPKLRFLRI